MNKKSTYAHPHLNIGVRLALAFGTVLALPATLCAIALMRTASMRDDMNAVTGGIAVESALAESMRVAATQQAVPVRNILMVSEPEKMAAGNELRKADVKAYEVAKARLARLIAQEGDARKKSILARIDLAEAQARELEGQVVQMPLDNHKFPARGLLGEQANPGQARWMAAVDDMVAFNEALTARPACSAKLVLIVLASRSSSERASCAASSCTIRRAFGLSTMSTVVALMPAFGFSFSRPAF